MYLTLPFRWSTFAISHTSPQKPTWADTQLRTNTSTHKPWYWLLLCCLQEWEELMWNVWLLGRLWCRRVAVPSCAPQWSYYQRPPSETKCAAGNLGNLSYAVPPDAVPPCPTHTQPVLCLYKDMGAGHPSLTKKIENKDEIQVRSHPETCRQGLACERRPPLRWGYCGGFTQWIYISGIPLMSALKRDFFWCARETL